MADLQENTKTEQVGFDWGIITKRKDLAFAFGIVMILAVLVVPLPKWMLDICLALSITFSILILMTVLFIQRPLDFNSFPTVLLIATMLRLSLNLASTRLILSDGHMGTKAAGAIIEAFGKFFMGGNFVIGIIVFSILVIVNFVVITKGSGRIAEVSARFTLDAMPGKQMAIDADLSAGLINETEARKRRVELEEESSFFGAMDGAAKFVRGDAIAGLLITIINVVGGIIIGTIQQGLTLGEAAQSYTILTVGDGLVAQIPALIVSTASGLLVTKGGIKGTTDQAFTRQLGGYPRALGMSAFLMFGLGLVPNVPMFPFLFLACLTGAGAWYANNIQKKEIKEPIIVDEKNTKTGEEQPLTQGLHLDTIRLEVGYGLIPLVNSSTYGTPLTDQIKTLRKQYILDYGFLIPVIRLQDNLQLQPNEYAIYVKEVVAAKAQVRIDRQLAIDPKGEPIMLPGEQTTEPAFGLKAVWIEPHLKEDALFRGYTVVDAASVIITHLTEIIKDNMSELLSYTETQKLIDEIASKHKKLIEDLIPSQTNVGQIQRVLQGLVKEHISIRDLPTILEGMGEIISVTKSTTRIIEQVRLRLSRQICESYMKQPENYIPLAPLNPQWEQKLIDSLRGPDDDRQLALSPSELQSFIQDIKKAYERFDSMGENPILLTNPMVRPYVRSILERLRPQTIVMSQAEIHPKVKIRTLGLIG
ncbi:MAG: flagellar biosynthesis protein FlhA [Alphaproteobacteria bacterium]|nr:flagellar biosynthesis protein FlhA [Alphaproteobacteria bacterium]MDP3533078.1 flagellar biosynthesis protein FlhA [Alphaproteobacteria bacterium]